MNIEMSVRDASKVCGVPVRTIYRWITDGAVAARHPTPRSTLVSLDDVLGMDEKRREATRVDGQ